MPDRIPSPADLREIGIRALAYVRAYHRPRDAGSSEGINAAYRRLASCLKESGGMAPIGWPDAVESVLYKLRSMCGGWLGCPTPADFPELDEEIARELVGRDSGGLEDPGGDPDAYLSFAEASALTAMRADQITRACDSGRVRSCGAGRGRLVHAKDLARYILKRGNR